MPEQANNTNVGARWFALYTRPRHEKAVHASLVSIGVEAFLPLHEVLSQWKDRRKWVKLPLFPGYLFARLPRERIWVARAAPGVVHLVSDGKGPVPVPDEQVLAVRELVERKVPTDPWPYVREGDLVLVKSGPLIGLTGFFVRLKDSAKLVISVDLLGRSVATEVGTDCVELLEEVAEVGTLLTPQSAGKRKPLSTARSRSAPGRKAGWLARTLVLLVGLATAGAFSAWAAGDGVAPGRGATLEPLTVRAGALQGRAVQPDLSTPIAGLPISLRSENKGEVAHVLTGSEGRFLVATAGAGPFELRAGVPGVEARLTAAEGSPDGDPLQVVLSRISTLAVPRGVPGELMPRPVPVTAVRRDGKVILFANPFADAPHAGPLAKWSRPWVGRTTP